MAESDNQRAAPRVQVEAFVKVDHESDEWVLRTRDLSETGLFLYTRVAHVYPFKVGSALSVELYDYNTFVSFRVVVARVVAADSDEASDYPVGFGVRIVEISPENKELLRNILNRVEGGENLY